MLQVIDLYVEIIKDKLMKEEDKMSRVKFALSLMSVRYLIITFSVN